MKGILFIYFEKKFSLPKTMIQSSKGLASRKKQPLKKHEISTLKLPYIAFRRLIISMAVIMAS